MASIPVLLNGESNEPTEEPSSALLPMVEYNDEEGELDGCEISTKISPIALTVIEKADAEQQTDGDINGETASQCTKCQTLEAESRKTITQITSKYETEITRVSYE